MAFILLIYCTKSDHISYHVLYLRVVVPGQLYDLYEEHYYHLKDLLLALAPLLYEKVEQTILDFLNIS